jgi:hypothetical protein
MAGLMDPVDEVLWRQACFFKSDAAYREELKKTRLLKYGSDSVVNKILTDEGIVVGHLSTLVQLDAGRTRGTLGSSMAFLNWKRQVGIGVRS